MIEQVERTAYQQEEARTPGSLARNILAMLIRAERRELTVLRRQQAQKDVNSEFLGLATAHWVQAHNSAESARRILYGWEL